MKNELATEQLALQAAFALNSDLLTADAAWGYDGSKEDFDRLYKECLAICNEIALEILSVDQICDTFWDFQLEVMNGQREVDWYLY
jgi:hypothetical protein